MKKYERNMSEGSIVKNLIAFSIPLILSTVLQLLFNAADIIVVGKFDGDSALAAVGSTSALINLFVNLFVGYTTGAGVIISRSFGAKDNRATQRAVGTCMSLSGIFSIVLIFLGFFASRPMLSVMQCPNDVLDGATLYMRIYFMGMPAFMAYNFGSGILRAIGDTKRPLYYLSAAGMINVVLNVIFVTVLKMSVAGVALATIISQYISAFFVIKCLIKSDASYRLDIKNLHIYKKEFILITKIGLPAGVQASLFSISNMTVQSAVNSFGTTVVAGNTAGSNVENFVYAVLNSMAQATMTFTGQNHGAGKTNRIKQGGLIGMAMQLVIISSLSALIVFFSKSILSIYSDNPKVIEIAAIKLSVVCASYFLCGFNENVVAVLRGLGCSALPMIISIFGICVLRIAYIKLVFPYFNTLQGLFYTYPISWTVTFIINGICLLVLWKRLTSISR